MGLGADTDRANKLVSELKLVLSNEYTRLSAAFMVVGVRAPIDAHADSRRPGGRRPGGRWRKATRRKLAERYYSQKVDTTWTSQELERDVVARHGFVHGLRTAILRRSSVFVILGSRQRVGSSDRPPGTRAPAQSLCMEGCPELERDVVARHGFVHGLRTAILCHSINSVILERPEITEISNSAQIRQKVKVP